MHVFDRRVIKLRRDRAAKKIAQHDYIIHQIAQSTADRLHGHFDQVLNLGSHTGQFLEYFTRYNRIINSDSSQLMLKQIDGIKVSLDEEALPFAEKSFDSIVSIMTLHRVNDLPGTLRQSFKILKTQGVFIGTLFGLDTLWELKQSIIRATANSGFSPRVHPFIDIKSAGSLMQRAGFRMIVSDIDTITIQYNNVLQLFDDLRYMGETNALLKARKNFTSKKEMKSIIRQYELDFLDQDNLIPATFEIITITGMRHVD